MAVCYHCITLWIAKFCPHMYHVKIINIILSIELVPSNTMTTNVLGM